MKDILNSYYKAIQKIPLLRYSIVLVVTIFILALAAYFELKNKNVFFYAFGVVLISFITRILANIIKAKTRSTELALQIITFSITTTLVACILSFAWFVVFGKPDFYKIWFPNQEESTKVSTPKISASKESNRDTLSHHRNKKFEKDTEMLKTSLFSIQLSTESRGYHKIFLDGNLINPLINSTRFNPRIELSDRYRGQRLLLIVTNNGDSCFSALPLKKKSPILRIVPPCY